MALINTQHVAGKDYEWNVTEPDVHISDNTAWIAYVNDGSSASPTLPDEGTNTVGIGLLAENRQHLEGPLHAQHPLSQDSHKRTVNDQFTVAPRQFDTRSQVTEGAFRHGGRLTGEPDLTRYETTLII